MPGWLIVALVAGVAILGLLLLRSRDNPRRIGYSENEKARDHWRTEHRDRRHDAGQEPAREEETSPLDRLPPEARGEVEDLLRRGRKIQAIKLVREVTGLGLRDAKDFVEMIERPRGGRPWG